MNDVKLSGRIATDIEVKSTPQGVAVCSFVLAVDRQSKDSDADWPTVVAWRQTAEFIGKYLGKGRKIIVEGRIRTRTYEDKDGKKHKLTEVEAERVEFADSKPADNSSSQQTRVGTPDDYEEILSDNGVPF